MKTVIDDYMVECTVEEFIKIIEWKLGTSANKENVNDTTQGVVHIERGCGLTKPKMVKVQRKGMSTVMCNSIREAQRVACIDFRSFSLARCFRDNNNRPVEVDGVTFTLVEQTSKDESNCSKKHSRMTKKKYMLIYPDGDNLLINLTEFCKKHNLPYEHIRKNTTYNPYQYGDFVFKKVH